MAQGIDSRLLKMMMEDAAQRKATTAHEPVGSMGVGVQSAEQRRATGNTFQALRERIAKAKAKKEGPGKKKKKATSPRQTVILIQLPSSAMGDGLKSDINK